MIAAIVPAAGRSERMGRPKLLMEHRGRSVLAGVVDALRRGGADPVIVVVPPAAEPDGPALADEAKRAGALVIAPAVRPAEMRESVEIALQELGGNRASAPEAVVVAPADSPGITPELVRGIVDQHRNQPDSVVVPACGGRRGHPILLPWAAAVRIPELSHDQGVNALVAAEAAAGRVLELNVVDDSMIADVDTPDDWARFQNRDGADEAIESRRENVTVLLFALARERAGASEIVVNVASSATVAVVKTAIGRVCPALADLLPSALIAVDSEFATDDQVVPPGAVVAIIPPVSGGGPPPGGALIEITESAIDHAAITDRVRSNQAGAVCTFLGTVREITGGRRTVALDYEAYSEMAIKKMADLDAEARRRWPIVESAIVHRVGRLELGEISIVIAVSTPHRRESFEACRWLIDTFKEVVPIWKKENWADGTEEWVHPGLPQG